MMAKILIVDDALFMRKFLGDILKSAGHEIIGEAQNAKEAIEQYEKLKPDVVTLDIIMPEVDEITSLKAIKTIKAFDKDANIIMVSAMGQEEIISESIQAGAKDFIIKPFQKQVVINAVQKLLDK
jgi:two-component system chemotaxis response regulator CheY